MKSKALIPAVLVWVLVLPPAVSALSVEVSSGSRTDIGTQEFSTEFGMVTGNIVFSLGELSWVPEEVWLIPSELDPDVFSKGLTQERVLEIPENITGSTCRTAVYYNKTSGYGFKIYNTGTTTQIFSNGTFCGLAFNGSYSVFAKY